jgi:IS5 family transposase
MLIIAYPPDPTFLARAPFTYQPEPPLRELDRLLDNPRLVMRVSLDLMKSAPRAAETGRPAMPVEVTLRQAVVRRLQGWSYREMESEFRGSLKWRWFCRVYDHPVPDHSTLQAREVLIQAATLHELTDLTVKLGKEVGVTQGTKLRSDSSVVETHIHYPTDSRLLADGVRVLGRTLARAREIVDGRYLRWHKEIFRNSQRQARRLSRRIGQLAGQRSRKKAKNKAKSEAKMKRLYGDLLRVVKQTDEHAQGVVRPLLIKVGSVRALALAETLNHFGALLQQVVSQTERRVLEGQSVPASEKIVSLFEAHTAIIQRGKAASQAIEYGRKVWYSEVDGGLVNQYCIQVGNPPDHQDQWVESLKHHRKQFGHPPKIATGDRGVYSLENEREAYKAGVAQVALPKPGQKTPEREEYEAQPWFKAAMRFRAGIEGRISVLRGPRGLRRCLNRGENGMERWVGWGIITNNLTVTAMALSRRHRKKKPATSEQEFPDRN